MDNHYCRSDLVDIGPQPPSKPSEMLIFDPKAPPTPTRLGQWILDCYSNDEIEELIFMIEAYQVHL